MAEEIPILPGSALCLLNTRTSFKMDRLKVCLTDEINRKNRCSGSYVTVSDNEEGTGQVTRRCSPRPNPLSILLPSHTALGYANTAPIPQNKIVAASHVTSIYWIHNSEQGFVQSTAFISLMQWNCCLCFRVKPQHEIEESSNDNKSDTLILLCNMIADTMIG